MCDARRPANGAARRGPARRGGHSRAGGGWVGAVPPPVPTSHPPAQGIGVRGSILGGNRKRQFYPDEF